MSGHPDDGAHVRPVTFTDAARQELVDRKVTCPFLGPAVAVGQLDVWNDAAKPLARIDDVVRLGNTGGGDLGIVLRIFAEGNQARMPGPSGALDTPVPPPFFSLDLPGSQGSHAGHSGILMTDPRVPGSGRFSTEAFERLLSHARDGVVARSDIGRFIARNVAGDPAAALFPLGRILLDTLESAADAPAAVVSWIEKHLGAPYDPDRQRDLMRRITKATGESHVVASCGEFGLLLAFLEYKPGARKLDGEPAVSVADLTTMFRDKRLPDGWESWPKTAAGWVANTLALLRSASSELVARSRASS